MANVTELPDILPYPKFLSIEEILKHIRGKLVYLIEAYEPSGLSVVVKIDKGHVMVRFGDFNGDILDPTNEIVERFGNEHLDNLTGFMKLSRVSQGIFYVTNDMTLVDFRISINKFAGPGYIKDLFSKIMRTQKVLKIAGLDDQLLESISSQKKDVYIKPSVYKFIAVDGKAVPLYASIKST